MSATPAGDPLLQRSFWRGAAGRAIRTAAQAFVSAFGVVSLGRGFLDYDWSTILSFTLLTTVLSVVTSLATPGFVAGRPGPAPVGTGDADRLAEAQAELHARRAAQSAAEASAAATVAELQRRLGAAQAELTGAYERLAAAAPAPVVVNVHPEPAVEAAPEPAGEPEGVPEEVPVEPDVEPEPVVVPEVVPEPEPTQAELVAEELHATYPDLTAAQVQAVLDAAAEEFRLTR